MFGKKKAKKPQMPQKPSAQRPVNPQRNASGNGSAPRNTVSSAAAQRPAPKSAVKKKGVFGGKKRAEKPAVSLQQRNPQNPQRVPQNQQRAPQKPQNRAPQNRIPQNQQNRAPQNRVPQNPQNRAPQKPQNRVPQKPIKPVNPQARKAVDKAALEKQSAAVKKRPYRGGNYTLYFVLFGIIAAVVLIILANTVLFKCGSIEVIGTSRYTAEEITASAGIKTGDNLLHINTKKAEENIIKNFAFVDKVAVKKAFPSKIQIEITEAANWFAIKQDNKIHVVSRGRRILGQISAKDLVVVNGFEAESVEVGSYIKSKVEAKNEIPDMIFETAEKVGFKGITEIDITDRFSIKISLGGRIILNLGPSTQLESKLRVAQALIEQQIGEDEQVVILLTNPERPAVDNLNPAPSPADKPDEPGSSSEPTESSSEPSENSSEPPESSSGVQDNSSNEQPDLITLPA